MIDIKILLFSLILYKVAFANDKQKELFPNYDEYISTCPVETIETFITNSLDIDEDNLKDPLKICSNIETNCCSKEVFTQGYDRFEYALRNPIIRQLNNFKEIRKFLYKLSRPKLEKTIKKLKNKNMSHCISDYQSDILIDLQKLKLAKNDIQYKLNETYNIVLRQYSGIICASCDSKYRRSLVKSLEYNDSSSRLIAVLDKNICHVTIKNQINFIDLVETLYPLFYFSKMLECFNNNQRSTLESDIILENLQEDKKKLKHCSLGENIETTECQAMCFSHINLIDYQDKYLLLKYIGEVYDNLQKYVSGAILESKAIFGLEISQDKSFMDDDDISLYHVYKRNENSNFNFNKFEIIVASDKAIDLTKDLMIFDHYKYVNIFIIASVSILMNIV